MYTYIYTHGNYRASKPVHGCGGALDKSLKSRQTWSR